ncbi:uncharacterized protein LOC124493657 [Dermatophagoides farinae]|uniref:uncharacterized protein LOC124493657 n=1 Tax=Dermatophagoides farinae TaxID=6954 RepID=UPI003F613F51
MNLAPNSYNSNIVYLNGHKNPFDRQFELALKNRIHHSQQQQSTTSTTTTFSSSSNENNNNNNNTYNPSSICCSSPLNTPLIQPDTAFNPAIGSDLGNVGGGDPTSTTITTAQITTLILESEIADDVNNNNNTNTNNNDRHCKETESNCCHQILHETPLSTSPSLNNNHSIVDNKTNDTLNDVQRYKQRSNAVSVICPPPYKDRGSEKIRSAPVILESANNIDDCSNGISNQNDDDDDDDDSIQQLMNKKRKRPLPATEIFNDFPAAKASTTQTTNIIPHHHITEKQLLPPPIPSSQSIQQQQQSLSTDSLIDSIQSNQKMVTNTDDDNNFNFTSTFPSSIITQSSCPSTITTTTTKTNYVKILPKQNNPSIDSNSNSNLSSSSSSTASGNSTDIMVSKHLSSRLPPPRRKEKTMDELIDKIKATEAALPPRAKPGRKSKSAAEEDTKEKKRLSLERNRAAAMRCRLKKKKEIDELKNRVEKYEQQNQQLKKIIDSLYNEVTFLKTELLRHKDCN